MKKPTVLCVTESSYLSSGYATYTHEVLKRLHQSNLFNIIEFSSFGDFNDPRIANIPWKFISNLPNPSIPEENDLYHSCSENKFGAWKFEEVCLKVKPDIVFSFRDWWADSFIFSSPFRDFYHYACMPTADGSPLNPQWIASYMEADAVFAYTDWSLELLKQQSGGKIKTMCSAPPGADTVVFKKVQDKDLHKQQMLGIPPNSFVIGSTMRNMKRKLYPDIIECFERFLKEGPSHITKNSYLYLHTAYPDAGWDIPQLLKDYKVAHKTFFTYLCRNCNKSYPSLFQDSINYCKHCSNKSLMFADSGIGISREELASVMNCFDVYLQISNCLKPGTEIYSDNGWKNIENLQIGEKVLTHTGKFQKILKTFKTPNKTTKKIKVHGNIHELNITDEHPVFAICKKDISLIKNTSLRETIGYKLRNKQELPKPKFVEAKDLQVGDLLCYQIDGEIIDIDKIDLSEYASEKDKVTDSQILICHGKIKNRYLEINEDFCKFIGLYVAEGCAVTDNNAIQITTHIKENYIRDDINKIFNFKEYNYQNRQAIESRFYSSIHSKFFLNHCKKGNEKKLPDFILKINPRLQLKVLEGLFAGDGHYMEKLNTTKYVTISKTLASQIEHLLRRNRIMFNLRLAKKSGNRQDQYTFEVPGNGCLGNFITTRSSSNGLYIDNFYFYKIKSIEENSYTGDVYNIEVENDNSYVTRCTTVHNCEGFGMPQVEAASCQVPVFSTDYSAMSDIVRKLNGIPINVLKFQKEAETNRFMAITDINDLFNKLMWFSQLPKTLQDRMGYTARKGVLEHYTYEKTSKIWADHFLSIDLKDHKDTWYSKSRMFVPNTNVPENLSNEEFVRWCIAHILNRPDQMNSYLANRLTRDLNWGTSTEGLSGLVWNDSSAIGIEAVSRRNPFTQKDAINKLTQAAEHFLVWEKTRLNEIK